MGKCERCGIDGRYVGEGFFLQLEGLRVKWPDGGGRDVFYQLMTYVGRSDAPNHRHLHLCYGCHAMIASEISQQTSQLYGQETLAKEIMEKGVLIPKEGCDETQATPVGDQQED